jgi:hypothetical protein
MVIKPIGYISKTDVEGTTSLIGPSTVGLSLKLKIVGGWRRIRSGSNMAR